MKKNIVSSSLEWPNHIRWQEELIHEKNLNFIKRQNNAI